MFLLDRLIDRLFAPGLLIGQLFDCLIDRSIDWLVIQLFRWLTSLTFITEFWISFFLFSFSQYCYLHTRPHSGSHGQQSELRRLIPSNRRLRRSWPHFRPELREIHRRDRRTFPAHSADAPLLRDPHGSRQKIIPCQPGQSRVSFRGGASRRAAALLHHLPRGGKAQFPLGVYQDAYAEQNSRFCFLLQGGDLSAGSADAEWCPSIGAAWGVESVATDGGVWEFPQKTTCGDAGDGPVREGTGFPRRRLGDPVGLSG